MTPNSPPPLRQSAAQTTLAPSPTIASGTSSRITPPHSTINTPNRSPNPNLIVPAPSPIILRRDKESGPTSPQLTSAEAYANAHGAYPSKRDKENNGTKTTKPIFDWISRKLGAGRRATISVGDGAGPSSPMPRVPPASTTRSRNPSVPAQTGNRRKGSVHLNPTQIFAPATLTRDNSIAVSRTESHSLRSYSMSYANSAERERRREQNNPYPSIPVPHPPSHRDSTIGSVSISYLSRSRTPSTLSDGLRVSLADDSSSRWIGADEDASLRPFPPSHPSSPTRSTSILSVVHDDDASPSSPRPETHRSLSSSMNSSDADRTGRQSRNDSTDTRPTTVFSFESHPHVAHIAQASSQTPHVPPRQPPFLHSHSALSSPLGRNEQSPTSHSATSVSDPAQLTPTTPTSPFSPSPIAPSPSQSLDLLQAPKHTQPHPRDNPHPSAPPEANASTLTLASSTFNLHNPSTSSPLTQAGISHGPVVAVGPAATRLRELSVSSAPPVRPTSLTTSPSVTFAPDPLGERPSSTYAYDTYSVQPPTSLSIRTGGWQSIRGGAADSNASVKAVRRRGSGDSTGSGWSWRDQNGGDRGSLIARDRDSGYISAHPKISRPSTLNGDNEYAVDGDTPGLGEARFDLERVGPSITA